jgi:hypothetical protein
MKVSLNLAMSRSPRERYALAWAAPLSALALMGLILLCIAALRGVHEYRFLRQETLKLEDQESALDKAEQDLRADLEQPTYRGLFRQTQFVNALIDRKRVSLTTLTERVTQLLPTSVRLAAFSLTQGGDRGRTVRFMVAGKSEEAIENFLINLEDSHDFKDVSIVNQSIDETSTAEGQVSVTCTARYVGSA